MLGIGFWTLFAVFVALSFCMIALIVMQKGRGGGLVNALAGSGGPNSILGNKTGDVLTWATSIMFGVFLLLAVTLNMLANA